MARHFIPFISHVTRVVYPVRYRLAFVFFIFALFQQQHLYLLSRQSLSAKYSPTEFTPGSGNLRVRSWNSEDDDSQLQDELMANRAAWKVLGEGCEGKVFAYNNSVIKTFTPGRSPFRNCAPHAMVRWPTEIPASLHFGGFRPVDDLQLDGFLPVRAYFMAPSSPSTPAEWHLVTPLLEGGSLTSLAKRLSTSDEHRSFRDVDEAYRPAFNQLLENLERLHASGYCHDDIKPSNIFIQDESNWLLGDLGNLRHVSHPYHTSDLWRDNEQLDDCRANDVSRALKSYLKFIQSSLSDSDEFNNAFFETQEPISRLLWTTFADAASMSARELRWRSLNEDPRAAAVVNIGGGLPGPSRPRLLMTLVSRRTAIKRAVDHTLETRNSEKMTRWWAMVWLFGVPESGVCGN